MVKMQNSDEFIKLFMVVHGYGRAGSESFFFAFYLFYFVLFFSSTFAHRRRACLFASHSEYFKRCIATVSSYYIRIQFVFFFYSHAI